MLRIVLYKTKSNMRNISFKNSAYPLLKRLKHHFQVYNFQIAGIEPRTVG